MSINLGTAAGNKKPFAVKLGIAGGVQKTVTKITIGTAAGNKVVYTSVQVGDVLADTNASGFITVPDGVASVLVALDGRGGAGGNGLNVGFGGNAAQGGGGGARASKTFAVSPGDTLTYTIDGTSTRLSSPAVTANVGSAGSLASPGAGGTASGGDTNTSGSAGGASVSTTGGAGGAAASAAAGGAGGLGNAAGSAGADYGGGGGGGGAPSAMGSTTGGAGGGGRVRITVASVA